MGWSGSGRKLRLPSDWVSRRSKVLVRDGGVCQWRLGDGSRCGLPATDVDHVVRGDDHSLLNLRALCREHHARKSAWEGASAYWAGVRESRRKFVRERKHPGVL